MEVEYEYLEKKNHNHRCMGCGDRVDSINSYIIKVNKKWCSDMEISLFLCDFCCDDLKHALLKCQQTFHVDAK